MGKYKRVLIRAPDSEKKISARVRQFTVEPTYMLHMGDSDGICRESESQSQIYNLQSVVYTHIMSSSWAWSGVRVVLHQPIHFSP
jgi:hypothetical protein